MHLWEVVGAGFLHITMIFCLYSGQFPDIPQVEFDYVQLDSVPMPILETCIHSSTAYENMLLYIRRVKMGVNFQVVAGHLPLLLPHLDSRWG